MRTIGFGRQARKHENLLDERTRGFFQNYVDGVNASIAAEKDLPLEFRLAGIKAEPWTIADSLAIGQIAPVMAKALLGRSETAEHRRPSTGRVTTLIVSTT
jgi:penicillin amidase